MSDTIHLSGDFYIETFTNGVSGGIIGVVVVVVAVLVVVAVIWARAVRRVMKLWMMDLLLCMHVSVVVIKFKKSLNVARSC